MEPCAGGDVVLDRDQVVAPREPAREVARVARDLVRGEEHLGSNQNLGAESFSAHGKERAR